VSNFFEFTSHYEMLLGTCRSQWSFKKRRFNKTLLQIH